MPFLVCGRREGYPDIVIAIVAAAAGTGLITSAIVFFARLSMSEKASVRRRLQLVEVLMALAIGALSTVAAENAKDRKLALLVLAFVVAAWVFRGTILLMRHKAR